MKLSISGLTIDFDTRFPEYIEKRCERYLCKDNSTPDMYIRASEENIEMAAGGGVSTPEAELYAMSISFSEKLPEFDRIMTHGVALTFKGKSYIFTAESGTGKSTHAFLWQKYFGEDKVEIINGDKPILWFSGDGTIKACGAPWNGKEGLDKNECVPLGGICLLKRLESSPEQGNRILKASPEDTLDFLLHQVFIPSEANSKVKTFQLLEKLYQSVPIYHLYADMSKEAVKVSAEGLTGELIG